MTRGRGLVIIGFGFEHVELEVTTGPARPPWSVQLRFKGQVDQGERHLGLVCAEMELRKHHLWSDCPDRRRE